MDLDTNVVTNVYITHSYVYVAAVSTDGEDRTCNNHDWQNFRICHMSPRNFQTSFHGSPKHFKQFFSEVNGSPRHSKEWPGNPSNLEIQIFCVWSPPWADYQKIYIQDSLKYVRHDLAFEKIYETHSNICDMILLLRKFMRLTQICATWKFMRLTQICATRKFMRLTQICATRKFMRLTQICATRKFMRLVQICATRNFMRLTQICATRNFMRLTQICATWKFMRLVQIQGGEDP